MKVEKACSTGQSTVIDRRIANRNYKVSELSTAAGLTLRRCDVPDRGALRNINSPEDLGR